MIPPKLTLSAVAFRFSTARAKIYYESEGSRLRRRVVTFVASTNRKATMARNRIQSHHRARATFVSRLIITSVYEPYISGSLRSYRVSKQLLFLHLRAGFHLSQQFWDQHQVY